MQKTNYFVKIIKTTIKCALKYFFTILTTPLILLIKLINPFFRIRLIAVDPTRIGTMLQLDFILKEKFFNKNKIKTKYIIYLCYGQVNHFNKQWLKMWTRVISFSRYPKFLKKIQNFTLKFIPIWEKYILNQLNFNPGTASFPDLATLNKVNIKFTDVEKDLGFDSLKKIGLSQNDQFVCFHTRDKAFLRRFAPNRNWDYHDFRDANIENYLKSINYLTEKKLFAFRMGSVVEKALETSNPKIIDFHRSKIKSDFMDIFLGMRCSFYICTESGISTIPEVFQKPIVYTNLPTLRGMQSFANNSILIFKKLYDCEREKLLTFREQIALCSSSYSHSSNFFKEKKIKLIENTPEEIYEAVKEMHERLNNSWKITNEDLELQKTFWEIVSPKVRSKTFLIGSDYLRKYKELLG